MSKHCRELLLAGLIAAALGATALAQEAKEPSKPRVAERFSGPVGVITPGGMENVDVSIQKWIVNGGTRVGLPRVDRGAVLVQLMAGSLTVIGKDSRVIRMEGDRWTVPQGQELAVEAGDDSAVLMVTVVGLR
jgi:redox-sensitive bicupin YhaK (pirin superfamily)